MAVSLDKLSQHYLLRGQDPYFSSGRRNNLRYALGSTLVSWTQLNSKGPEPFEYLEYAKSDLIAENGHGYIDALGHAKRAVHLTMDALLEVWGLDTAYGKAKFPDKLTIMQELNAFPTRLIGDLNRKRNLVEHEYESVKHQEAAVFVDIAEMFLLLAYPFLKHAVIGAYVGLENDNRCLEWKISFPEREVHVSIVHCEKFLETPIGYVYYNIHSENKRSLQSVLPIKRTNLKEWLPFLDLFVYCTKRAAVRLPEKDDRGHGFFMLSQSLNFFD